VRAGIFGAAVKYTYMFNSFHMTFVGLQAQHELFCGIVPSRDPQIRILETLLAFHSGHPQMGFSQGIASLTANCNIKEIIESKMR
jgi:hypothetical protein